MYIKLPIYIPFFSEKNVLQKQASSRISEVNKELKDMTALQLVYILVTLELKNCI